MNFDTSIYSQELEDLASQQSNLGAYRQLNLWNLTPTLNKSCDHTSPKFQSTLTSETTAQLSTPSISSRWDFLVREQAARAKKQESLTQNQPSGVKDLDVYSKPNPSSVLLSNLLELSDEDLEQSLDSSSWLDIVGNLKLSRQAALEQVIKDSDYLSFPTLTSGQTNSKTRPAGQTKCEKWFKDKDLIPSGSQLSAPAIAMIMGFPKNWFNTLLPIAAQEESEPDISQVKQLPQDKQQSPSLEFLNSTAINKAVIQHPALETVIQHPALETVIQHPALETVIPSRKKGEGSGSIYYRKITKNSKEYQQAYFHYEIWSQRERVIKSSHYIPRRKEKLINSMNQAKVPIKIILDLLNS